MRMSYGLGESVVGGKVTGDRHIVFKETEQPINNRLGDKKIKVVYKEEGGTKTVNVPEHDQSKFALTPQQIRELGKYGKLIHEHYGRPMDVEFGVEDGIVYILQARPETVYSQKGTIEETYTLREKGNLILEGLHIGTKIGQGEVNVMKSVEEMHEFQEGQVLVTEMTDPDWVPVMKKASAIVTEKGGKTCHAAIVSRELGVPCIVGAENAMKELKGYNDVTVDCSEGRGLVYEGRLKFDVETLDISKLPKTKTQIMMNIGVPDGSLKHGKKVEGIGLARMEFILANVIGIHPKALLEYEKLKEIAENARKVGEPLIKLEGALEEIEKRTRGYDVKSQFFVDKVAEGIATIAAGVYPYDTVVRLSDFKTNEYRDLVGGYLYEPEESNPMLGWRGASRYTHPNYKDAFRLECQALKKAREEMGLKNIVPMIPFNRTIDEAKKVLEIMKEEDLERGKNDLRVYVMAEIPSNIILANQFAELYDGFSIGSNDLTQLTLGVDRDSQILAGTFDERNDAVKSSLEHLIKTAHQHGKKVGICGQAPSDHPEIVEFLVNLGIDSMSLNTDVIGRMKEIVSETEKKLEIKPEVV